MESMTPIINLIHGQMQTSLEGELYRAVQQVAVDVDKERLLQALIDARSFWHEGYGAGQRDAAKEIVRCKNCRMARLEREFMGEVLYCLHWCQDTEEDGYCHEGVE